MQQALGATGTRPPKDSDPETPAHQAIPEPSKPIPKRIVTISAFEAMWQENIQQGDSQAKTPLPTGYGSENGENGSHSPENAKYESKPQIHRTLTIPPPQRPIRYVMLHPGWVSPKPAS